MVKEQERREEEIRVERERKRKGGVGGDIRVKGEEKKEYE